MTPFGFAEPSENYIFVGHRPLIIEQRKDLYRRQIPQRPCYSLEPRLLITGSDTLNTMSDLLYSELEPGTVSSDYLLFHSCSILTSPALVWQYLVSTHQQINGS
ncbi:hypothetical protein GUJ93_ZPchr0012g21607 [Zizania palustris]|uniref:Uncharacterized protein n=1 Tax=Zizania palustris TaxID=103762 RepID=A0A8J5WTQ5_ZIZPA|nr:hypothetical protein GUJ93_ZPchr0012g21607 [Zizania palustris]